MFKKIAGIYSEDHQMEKERYDLFFSFYNLFAVFRSKKSGILLDRSTEGEIVFSGEVTSSNIDGLLDDILFMAKLGRLDLRINDVIVARFNGLLKSYRFRGISKKNPENNECFVPIRSFAQSEKNQFIQNIHSENKVLSVLDGRILHLSNINLKKIIPCAIDGKVFELTGDTFMLDYALYVYDNDLVRIIDPEQRPFIQINVALLYFEQMKYKKQPLLLLDRSELEMIRDFYQIQKLAFV